MKRSLLPAVIVVTTALVAVLDVCTSAELIGSILFTLPLALCAVHGSKGLLWGAAAAAALLTVAAGLWGVDRIETANYWLEATNRGLLILSLLTLTTLIHVSIGKTRRLLQNATQMGQQSSSLKARDEQLEVLVAGAARDLGERLEAEDHLASVEDRYRGLLEAAPDAMIVVNEGGVIVLLNLQAKKQFGYGHGELVGQPVTQLIPEGFAQRLIADGTRTAAEALAQQIGNGIELVGRRKDSSEFPIEIMLSPLLGEDGILVTAAIRDISVRKAAERRLAQLEGRYRGLLEAAPDAMVLAHVDGRVVLVNVQAEKQFGYRRDELFGQALEIIIPGVSRWIPEVNARTAATPGEAGELVAKEIGAGIESMGRHKDGRTLPLEITLSTLPSSEGVLVTVAIRDISARKLADAQLRQKVEELNRSNEELAQFAYIASHDLQEPLRMVASYTQLLSRRYKGKLDTDADEFIAFAVDGANRMQRLIQDLLAYSRIGTGGKVPCDTASERALERATLNLSGAIEDSGALVTHDPLPLVVADESQLTQLFQNLVGNAIKYQGPGTPHVHIAAVASAGKKWTFSVQDNGLGIDPRYHEKIFGMFQRLHKRDEFAGTGIGLAICKKIVERHGGRLSVESQLGHGSTFRFALPAHEALA